MKETNKETDGMASISEEPNETSKLVRGKSYREPKEKKEKMEIKK
jgi:hypothetical protein